MQIVRISALKNERFRSLFVQLRAEGSLLKSHFWRKILKIMKIQVYAGKMNGNWKKFVA